MLPSCYKLRKLERNRERRKFYGFETQVTHARTQPTQTRRREHARHEIVARSPEARAPKIKKTHTLIHYTLYIIHFYVTRLSNALVLQRNRLTLTSCPATNNGKLQVNSQTNVKASVSRVSTPSKIVRPLSLVSSAPPLYSPGPCCIQNDVPSPPNLRPEVHEVGHGAHHLLDGHTSIHQRQIKEKGAKTLDSLRQRGTDVSPQPPAAGGFGPAGRLIGM